MAHPGRSRSGSTLGPRFLIGGLCASWGSCCSIVRLTIRSTATRGQLERPIGSGVKKRLTLIALPLFASVAFLGACNNKDKPSDVPTWTVSAPSSDDVSAVPPSAPVSVSVSPSVSVSASPSESVSTKVEPPTMDASCDPKVKSQDPDC